MIDIALPTLSDRNSHTPYIMKATTLAFTRIMGLFLRPRLITNIIGLLLLQDTILHSSQALESTEDDGWYGLAPIDVNPQVCFAFQLLAFLSWS